MLRLLLLLATLLRLHAESPNVLYVLVDDMGFADVGVNGCTDIPTPHLDALAKSGINFTAGYVTHPYCSPSRAAIMSGRYQARFGHDCNPQQSFEDHTQGIPASVKLLPARLEEQDYTTALIGKWHLGHADPFKPRNRGFDHFWGFLAGGYSYWGHPSKKNPGDPIYENDRIVAPDEITYMTSDLGHQAIKFIKNNPDKPWFCYLSYSAPHAPDQAPKEVIARFAHIEDYKRKMYAALVSSLDDSVGEVIAALDELGIRENTLVFFLSDNGGRHPSADNGIYRGHKGRTYEGGVRVPFMASWPSQIPAGQTSTEAVSSLDLYATILELAGASDPGADGINLLSHLKDPTTPLPTRPLFYRISGGWGYAISDSKYKLVKPGWKDEFELYDIQADPSEENNLIAKLPLVASQLLLQYQDWNKDNIAPLWDDPHKANVDKELRGESLN
ncbi:MAG: sulfatase-like hydrolase/transferase [Verrucomicrobiota bacterium]